MKIIIVYASAGAGHRKAAEATYSYFRKAPGNNDVCLIDVLTESSILLRFFYTVGYSFLITRLIFLWRLGFWLTRVNFLRHLTRFISACFNRFNTRSFSRFLIRENPDAIISTHFLSSEIAAGLKLKNKISSKLYTVITDLGVHPFWISEGTDYYVVACEYTKDALLAEGIAPLKIKELGIPVDEKFLKCYNRQEVAKVLGLDKDKFTVLLITGSFGIGPLEDIAWMLHNDVQVIVVCALNKKLYQRLQQRRIPNVRVFGFVDNPQDLMAISDVIITKPGGLTISEVIAMELVPIFIYAIPGQEMENVMVLHRYGVGVYLGNMKQIRNVILDLKNFPEKIEAMKAVGRKIKKYAVLQELYNAVCENSSRASG